MDTAHIGYIGYTALIILLISITAFLSAAEAGIFSVPITKIKFMEKKNVKNAAVLRKLRENSSRTLSTFLFAFLLTDVLLSVIATILFVDIFGHIGIILSILVISFLVITFGEIIPKSYAIANERFAASVSLISQYIYKGLFPVVFVLDNVATGIMKFFKISYKAQRKEMSEEDLRGLLERGKFEGTILKEEKEMVENVLEFKDIDVKEIMTHRTDIEGIDISSNYNDIIYFFEKTHHSYAPVFDGSIDEIKGILRVNDPLLKEILIEKKGDEKKLKETILSKINAPFFVPKCAKVDYVFKEMKKRKIEEAIVVDEYGGTSGIVTMDDLGEEIVGDFLEMDEEALTKISPNAAIFPGDTRIETIGNFFGEELEPDGDYETAAGCILENIERLPEKGGYTHLKNFKFIAEDVGRNKILKVKVVKEMGEKGKSEKKIKEENG